MPSEKPYDEAIDVQDSEDIVTPRPQNSQSTMEDFEDRQLKSKKKPAQPTDVQPVGSPSPLDKAPRRLQAMLVRLQKYNFEIGYTPGKNMVLADTLSRAPLATEEDNCTRYEQVHLTLAESDSRLPRIRQTFADDEEMEKLEEQIRNGWPDNARQVGEIIRPYFKVRDELTTENGLVFRGERLVIPRAAGKLTMQEIHRSHLGVCSCTRRAKDTVYWPGMTSYIKDFISTCIVCKQYGTRQPKEPMVCRSVPKRPWQHVAVDLFSHADNSYLLLVDYFSDFFEIEKLNTTSAEQIIGRLKAQFARYGIPECLRSDGGPQFSAQQFAEFAEKWRFKYEVSSPHHSQSNGKAESVVKEANKIMKKCLTAKEDVYQALLEHRNTPSADIDLSPAQRLMGRRTRTRISLVEDRLALQTITWDTVRKRLKQPMERKRQVYNKGSHELPRLDEGNTVWIQPFGMGPRDCGRTRR
ncbi:hypothetical protein EG68_08998 [Paragonimus skrjabini miyazakii]|uniref:Integrase catalytic domain-containing protein n=1 Tax=Paragonimus skrjabini miyazakii TaxID=59628 RepID=A0A8S9YQY9_9TREM|nr:hypothetical protein EG68_08998 [Paragonimus skrjabini miyazakii]